MLSSFTNTDWLTLALVVITAFYAWATYQILRANQAVVLAMREQTEAQYRPYVVSTALARTGTPLLLLEIQNTGRSPAEKLRLTIDKDFYQQAELREDNNLAKFPAFSETIECLAPGSKLQFILGMGHTILAKNVNEELCPKVFTITATYGFAKTTFTETNTIDLRPLLQSSVIHDPVAQEVEKLRGSLEKILKK